MGPYSLLDRPLPDVPELHHVGRLASRRAADYSALEHRHPCVEISFIRSGMWMWFINDTPYLLTGGDVLVSMPREVHGGHLGVVGACQLDWVGVSVPDNGRRFLGLEKGDARVVADGILSMPRRHMRAPASLANLFDRLLLAARAPLEPTSALRARACLVTLLLDLADASRSAARRDQSPLVTAAIDLMRKNFSTPLRIGQMAAQLACSESTLKHTFRSQTGVPPAGYYLHLRIAEACRLLTDGATITETAFSLGFTSTQYFAFAFRRLVGASPSQWAAGAAG